MNDKKILNWFCLNKFLFKKKFIITCKEIENNKIKEKGWRKIANNIDILKKKILK